MIKLVHNVKKIKCFKLLVIDNSALYKLFTNAFRLFGFNTSYYNF